MNRTLPFDSVGALRLGEMRLTIVLLLVCGLGRAMPAPQLTAAEQQKVLHTLLATSGGDHAPALTLEALNEAALRAIAADPALSISWRLGEAPPPSPSQVRASVLTGAIGYFRPIAFSAASVPAWRTQLLELRAAGVQHLILDFRLPAPDTDPREAITLAGLFLPAGATVTSSPEILTTAGPRAWEQRVAILIDRRCSNTAEILAAILQSHGDALTVGSRTAGRSASFAELELRPPPERLAMRYPSHRWVIQGVEDFFASGLAPRLSVPPLTDLEHQQLDALISHSGLPAALASPPLPRLNEAALITRTNPEVDWRASPQDSPTASPTDRALQAAVDSIVLQSHFQPPSAAPSSAALPAPASPPPAQK